MTVIAAVARHGQVAMATDDTMTESGRFYPGPAKVRRIVCGGSPVEVLMAAAGAAELLTYWCRHRELLAPWADLDDWAQGVAEEVTEVAAGMNPSCVVGGPSPDERGALDGMMLLGHAGRLWTIDANMAVRVPDGVMAMGSGGQVAIGVLHGALAHGATPCQAVTSAVLLACRHTDSCALLGAGPTVEVLDHG